MKVVKSPKMPSLTVGQRIMATIFLPFYVLGSIIAFIWNIAINPPVYTNRMIGIIRIIVMLSMISYEAGFIFDKHAHFVMYGFQNLGIAQDTSELLSTLFWIAIVCNIIFQFVYVVILGASTYGESGNSAFNGSLDAGSGNGIGRMLRGLDYELSMRNTRAGQKEVFRDWFGGK